ncbi:MAG: helix-turn-helix transcriptional regulator [Thermodesulfobacteriota bacterium]|nr:helix-turn-helix transcriptional regulator [Thermodesulfobacteriota bacterium]
MEHTKKPPIELRFLGPLENREEAIIVLRTLGFSDVSDSIPWKEAFKEFEGNEVGTSLRGARYKEDLTQIQLAEKTGIPQRHISEMERGKRPIGKKNAKLFANILNINYRIFL